MKVVLCCVGVIRSACSDFSFESTIADPKLANAKRRGCCSFLGGRSERSCKGPIECVGYRDLLITGVSRVHREKRFVPCRIRSRSASADETFTYGAADTAGWEISIDFLRGDRSHPTSSTRCGVSGAATSARSQNSPRSGTMLRSSIRTQPNSTRSDSITRLHAEPAQVSSAV